MLPTRNYTYKKIYLQSRVTYKPVAYKISTYKVFTYELGGNQNKYDTVLGNTDDEQLPSHS